jgi:hypothetical protein
LYTLFAVRLIEPDNEDIDSCYKKIKANITGNKIEKNIAITPKGMALILDSNTVISHIFHDVGDYRIKPEKGFDLEKLGNDNEFLITNSTREEVLTHIEFKMVTIRTFCNKNPRFSADEIENTIKKRLDNLCTKYGYKNIEVKKEDIANIKAMYLSHIGILEEILLSKTDGKYVSQKLRKLSQRESMLPEEGDIKLLAECMVIKENTKKDIGILTKDKDFTEFASEIKTKFGVEIIG